MTNMVLRVPTVALVVQVVSAVSMVQVAFGGFEDIFSSFFGGGGASRNPNAPRQGDDLQYRVNLTFEEAILELKKKLKVQP